MEDSINKKINSHSTNRLKKYTIISIYQDSPLPSTNQKKDITQLLAQIRKQKHTNYPIPLYSDRHATTSTIKRHKSVPRFFRHRKQSSPQKGGIPLIPSEEKKGYIEKQSESARQHIKTSSYIAKKLVMNIYERNIVFIMQNYEKKLKKSISPQKARLKLAMEDDSEVSVNNSNHSKSLIKPLPSESPKKQHKNSDMFHNRSPSIKSHQRIMKTQPSQDKITSSIYDNDCLKTFTSYYPSKRDLRKSPLTYRLRESKCITRDKLAEWRVLYGPQPQFTKEEEQRLHLRERLRKKAKLTKHIKINAKSSERYWTSTKSAQSIRNYHNKPAPPLFVSSQNKSRKEMKKPFIQPRLKSEQKIRSITRESIHSKGTTLEQEYISGQKETKDLVSHYLDHMPQNMVQKKEKTSKQQFSPLKSKKGKEKRNKSISSEKELISFPESKINSIDYSNPTENAKQCLLSLYNKILKGINQVVNEM